MTYETTTRGSEKKPKWNVGLVVAMVYVNTRLDLLSLDCIRTAADMRKEEEEEEKACRRTLTMKTPWTPTWQEPEVRNGSSRPPLLYVVCSQIYDAISHHIRNSAKFHKVRLGLMVSSLAGTTATSLPSKNRWHRILERCRGDLPHVRCAQKLAGPGKTQCNLKHFENTYRLDV